MSSVVVVVLDSVEDDLRLQDVVHNLLRFNYTHLLSLFSSSSVLPKGPIIPLCHPTETCSIVIVTG